MLSTGDALLLLTGYNVLVFAVYAYDKFQAGRGGWRVPEARLLGMAFWFGGPGALLAVHVLRHKTRKQRFVIGIPVMLAVQAVLAVAALGYFYGWWGNYRPR